MKVEKPRVLIIAESANPDWVSVPLEGWSHSLALSRQVNAHVVTHLRNREAILRKGWIEGRDFTAIDSELVARPISKLSQFLRGGSGKGWTTAMAVMAPAYYYFEQLAWDRFRKEICGGEFDLVHRITPLSPTLPSRFMSQCAEHGVPFVLGPLNGGVPWPKEFDDRRRAEKEWLSYIRSIYKLMPGYWKTLRNASKIICGSRYTMSQIPRQFSGKCEYVAENAVDPERFTRVRKPGVKKPVRAVFVGRLVPYKCADILIKACKPFIQSGELKLKIVGDGPEMPRLKGMADSLGDGVEFAGWVNHIEVQKMLSESDLFIFPSIREFGGAVVMEAMAVGLPSIVVDYAGPGETVNDGIGWKAKLGTFENIVEGLENILRGILSDPEIIDVKGAKARGHVLKHFTWDAKARQVVKIYKDILDSGTNQ